MPRLPIFFNSAGERLAGELWLPDTPGPHPAVLLIGGTISDTRDGDPAPYYLGAGKTHGMLRVMAQHLAAAGIASFRWDKRGVGESTGPEDRLLETDNLTDLDDAEQALHALASAPDIDAARIAVLGESAGALIACLLATRSELPIAYVMQGALHDNIPDMIAFNYGRIEQFRQRGPEADAWVKAVAPNAYRTSSYWRQAIQAAKRGESYFETGEGESLVRFPLRRWKSDLDFPPADQFRYIQKPTLVIQGASDLNVPPNNYLHVAQSLRAAGNAQVTVVNVPRADHSMQLAPDDLELRVRERISMDSFARPYSQFFLYALAGWLRDQFNLGS